MNVLKTECPHCYSDVLVMANGMCPGCQKDTRAAAATSASLTKMSLPSGAKDLPHVCIICGGATQRKERFYRKAKNSRYNSSPSQVGGAVGGAWGLLFTWIFDYASGKMYQEISLDIPVCDECKRQRREVRVKYLDFDRQA